MLPPRFGCGTSRLFQVGGLGSTVGPPLGSDRKPARVNRIAAEVDVDARPHTTPTQKESAFPKAKLVPAAAASLLLAVKAVIYAVPSCLAPFKREIEMRPVRRADGEVPTYERAFVEHACVPDVVPLPRRSRRGDHQKKRGRYRA